MLKFCKLGFASFLFLVLWPNLVISQTSTANLSTFHGVGDSDHADAVFTNFAGIGFGSQTQLAMDGHFLIGETSTQSSTNLSGSVRFFDIFGLAGGYRFGRKNGADPQVLSLSLSDGESWSLAQRWSQGVSGSQSDFAGMFRPTDWLSVGTIAHGALVEGRWRSPRYEGGLMLRPFGRKHRLGLSSTYTGDWARESTGVQWFSRLFQRFEVGMQYLRTVSTDQHLALLTVRTLSGLSLGAGFGALQREDTTEQVATWSARIRHPAQPSKRLSGRATIASVEISNAKEYQVSGWFSTEASAPFLVLLQQLDALANRNDVQGVLLKMSGFDGGWAQCEELRHSILGLKKAGKKVYVFLPFADMRTYAVAAAADEILTTPTGGYDLSGATISSLHIKGLLDKVGVQAEFVTTGPFKTAPEMFTKTRPSEPSTQTQNEILDVIFDTSKAAIAEGRSVPVETVDKWIEHGLFSGAMLSDHKLVDQQLHLDQAERYLRAKFGGRTRIRAASKVLETHPNTWGKQKKIAVLYAVGSLIDGKTPTGFFSSGEATGSTTFINSIRAIAKDPNVVGVVVRVNSPGGTISASDTMWRSLSRLSRKKPVVVSLSNVAASGGYYTAVGAPKIYANERTLTGSIGVFAGKFNFAGLLNKWGVYNQTYQRGPHAGLLSPTMPWSDAQRAAMQKSIDHYDDIFQSRVSAGRKLDRKTVKKAAAGRVYMGKHAQRIKLVDEIGGLSAAIKGLKSRLGLSGDLTNLVVYPEGDGDGRSFSLPTLVSQEPTIQWAEVVGQLKSVFPQLGHLVPLLLTLSQSEMFALAPELWLMK